MIALTGGPKTGKTTLAKKMEAHGFFVVHADVFAHLPWKDQPQAILDAVEVARRDSDRVVLVEGVQVARACRKGLRPDWLIVLHEPMVTRTVSQVTMAKGVARVIQDVTTPSMWMTYEEAERFILTYGKDEPCM